VHTKRNLKALEDQQISLARREAALAEQAAGGSRPQFEHTLLLGHVSMLTAICVSTATTTAGTGTDGDAKKTREYIITADRDEHIRVSRGMPQAHVIEGFCLGHEDFVSRLCVAPGGKTEVLISGGGDDYLFVWDWLHGRLLGRAGVLEYVRGVAGQEEASKVAVTRVFACRWEEGRVAVFVVVERYVSLPLPSEFVVVMADMFQRSGSLPIRAPRRQHPPAPRNYPTAWESARRGGDRDTRSHAPSAGCPVSQRGRRLLADPVGQGRGRLAAEQG
jgi:tRNA (guanine-N(7)-)-methyltransferase subunit TRM82